MHLSTKACATSSFVTRSVGRNLFQAAAALDRASASRRWLHPEDVSGDASATVAMVLAETQAIPVGVLSEFSGWSNHACCACQLSRPRISSIAAARCNVCKSLITVCIALISELLATAILAVKYSFSRASANKLFANCLRDCSLLPTLAVFDFHKLFNRASCRARRRNADRKSSLLHLM